MAPSRKKGASKAAAAAAARRQYKVGDLVLAKVKGFPAWPATVSEPEKWGYPPDWKKILVYFFGTQQIAFCNPADVEAFTEEKKQSLLGKRHGKGADFGRAVREIIESYEQMKKQDHASSPNAADDAMVIGDGSVELSVKSLVDGDDAHVAPKSCDRDDAKEDDVNAKSEIGAAVNGSNGSEEKDGREKEEDSSSFLAAETVLTNRDSSRENSERTVEPKYFTRRRPPSTRRARTASRVGSNKPQLRMTRSGTVAPSVLSDEPARRNKRIRKSPDVPYEHAVDSPGLNSNGSIEGNDSEILTADSDSFSLNDGSTVDSKCKNAVPDSSRGCEESIEVGQRLEFQTNGISKKKRMPNRKRPSSDTVELTAKPGEKISSDAVKCERIIPGDQEISTKKLPKEAGDEHLPLVKRARVRMGRISAGEQPETSFDTEEKPPEVCSSMSDHVHVSSDREGDDSSDCKPSSAKGDLEKLLRPDKHQTVKRQVWEARKYQHLGSSVEGEAALPPSKRLHRALEAMSANAAEENQTASDVPSMAKVDTSGCYSSASDDCSKSYLDRKLGDESEIGTAEENVRNIKSQDGAAECSMKIDPSLTEERVSSGACCTDESGKQKPFEDNVDKSMLKSSADPIDNSVALQSSESLLLRVGSPGVPLPSGDDCKTGSSKLAKPCETNDHQTNLTASSIHCGVDIEIDRADDNGANHVSEVKLTLHSPHSGTDMETNIAGDECGGTVVSQIVPHESKLSAGMSNKDVGNTPSMEDSSATLFPVAADVRSNNTEKKDRSQSTSAAENHLGDRITSLRKSSPPPTYSLETTTTGARPRTSTSNLSSSLNSSIQVASSRSTVSHTHHDIQKSSGKWNFKEAQDALKSFEACLGTLTRTKENINRATRSAIDCAKFGVATKVIEILTHSLERETNLPKRVDLFFLVDSIAQHSRGLKGDVAGVYPSAILPVLPRLLSAAAPPGSNSQDNRKQCLKVLKVWQDRRILPESIVRHHIRELESLCGSSCPRALSRRQRNERAFDDPIREMEGMLVDEYGSNSSIQLPGFSMPPMLKDEDDGVDSDGESFEAVTPEHETGKSEVEKHRHILEDVDGELEMEDVAPSSDALISSTDSSATNTVQKMHTVGNVTFAPPLPRDFPPISPPLPRSPPPLPQLPLPPPPPPPGPPPHLAPRPSFPLPSDMPDNPSRSAKPKGYNSSQNNGDDLRQSNVPPVKPTLPDAVPSSRPNQVEFRSQVPKQLSNSTPGSLNSRPISNVPARGSNNTQQSDGAYNKGFRLRPPHPAPSNQFSYVQTDHRVQSRRDIPPPPPPHHPNRYHVQHAENGNFYREADGMPPHDTGDHWRGPPFPGPRYPDGPRMNYGPAPYGGQHGEPVHGNRWGYPHGEMNHRMGMPHRPPAGAPIPVAARGPNCWRPPR